VSVGHGVCSSLSLGRVGYAKARRVQAAREGTAPTSGPANGDPGVAPSLNRPLYRQRQEGVDDSRAEVAGRVDRVTGGTAEGEADADDHEGGHQGAGAGERQALGESPG